MNPKVELRPIPLENADPESPTSQTVPSPATRNADHKKWASFLAFLIVFLVWDFWDSFILFLKQDSEYGPLIHAISNLLLLALSLTLMQKKGPSFMRTKRVVSVASVLAAVGVWDILDLLIGSLVEPGHVANLVFYAVSLVIVSIAVLYYEKTNDYDIIGEHLNF